MTEAEWLVEQRRSQAMVRTLLNPGKLQRTKTGRRKLRLFSCGCCRLICWDLLTDPRSQQALETAERFADGQADNRELQAAYQQNLPLTAGSYMPTDPGVFKRLAAHMALSTTAAKAGSAAFNVTALPALNGLDFGGRRADDLVCHLLRCVFGNPFRPVAVVAPVWKSDTILQLAAKMYDDRAFDQLPILADALEEAGCTDAAILNHCRGPGPHVRGCWVLDQLLGNK